MCLECGGSAGGGAISKTTHTCGQTATIGLMFAFTPCRFLPDRRWRNQRLSAILWQRSLNSSHGMIDSAPSFHRTTTAASPAAVALMVTSCGTSRCGAPAGLGAPGSSARFARGMRYSRPCHEHAVASHAGSCSHLVGHGRCGVQLSRRLAQSSSRTSSSPASTRSTTPRCGSKRRCDPATPAMTFAGDGR